MRAVHWKCGLVLVAALLLTSSAAAEDTVYLASGSGTTKVTGRILDYTGRELQLETFSGRAQSYPARLVQRIETEYADRHVAADAAMARRQFAEALALYQQALEAESRRWVRRLIVAQYVWCYRALGQWERAGEAFLLLARDDPETPYFACIPLAWLPTATSLELDTAARRWLGRPEPAAALLGASHLLSGADRPAALRRLEALAAGQDRRIADLARAQTWRAAAITADRAQLEAWLGMVEQMPASLRAGPYFVLGRAWAQQQQWQEAALTLLRAAILYPDHRDLAPQALLEAGVALEKMGEAGDAARLYREVARSYAESRVAVEAESRLGGMTKDEN